MEAHTDKCCFRQLLENEINPVYTSLRVRSRIPTVPKSSKPTIQMAKRTVTAVSAECVSSACRDLLLTGKDLPRAAVVIVKAVLKRTRESATRAAIKTPQCVFEEAANEPSLSYNHCRVIPPAKIHRNHLSAHE